MRSVVTCKIKICPTKQVIATVKAYTKSLQYCVDVAWKNKISNNIKLHRIVYKKLRKNLPAQLAIACIKQAASIVKKAKTKPFIKRGSVRYNFPRSANLKSDVLILRLLKTRQKFKINIPPCYKKYFTWDIKESLLRLDKKGRCFFLFTFSKEINALNDASQLVLGIDFGVNKLAVTSDNRFYGSAKVKQIKRRFRYIRAKLQSKGTRAAKRLLRKISGRETRFMAWINHNISKNIVANFNGSKIIMENLKGIRKKNRGKRLNYWISNWSFFQLQSFIQYKAIMKGIETIKVKPHYTSQICHRCGKLGTRSFGCFCCLHCGLSSYSADLNAARNLSHPMLGERQAAVNQPYLACDDAENNSRIVMKQSIAKSSTS